MLDFKPICIKDKTEIDKYLHSDRFMAHERNFACLYIWNCHFEVETCIKNDVLYSKIDLSDDKRYYYPPLGYKNIAEAVGEIESDAGNTDYTILALSPSQMEELEAAFPGKYSFAEDRDSFDYIYLSENLITLKGKAYHGKRNHLNKFFAQYVGQWEYRDIDPLTDRKLLMDFQKQWCLERDDDKQDDFQGEFCAIGKALDYYNELNMCGGILFVDDKIAAFTLASELHDGCMEILIEKAVGNVDGAYTMINNEFARRHCADHMYINREEDMGIEGLRVAKLSYRPTLLSEKYNAVVKE